MQTIQCNKFQVFFKVNLTRLALTAAVGMISSLVKPAKIMARDQINSEQANRRTQSAMRAIPKKVDIIIVPGASEINSGLVITYGHPLKPPFQFVNRDSAQLD